MCEKFGEFWGVEFNKICEFSREFWGAKFGKFCKFFGANFCCFCDFKILNLREFLVVFLKKFTKFREFWSVRHCEQKQAVASFCVEIHYLTKSRFKYKISTQKRTACVMDCFEPNGSRNDELFAFFAHLKNLLPNKFQYLFRKNFLNFHKNLPPNLKQNFKSKYQKTKPQFLYLNSFKRQINA